MKKYKNKFLLAFCLLVSFSFFWVVSMNYTTTTSVTAQSATPSPITRWYGETKPMPVELMYWSMFQEVQALKEKDAEFYVQGENTAFKNSFLSGRLGLQPSKFAAVENIVNVFFSDLQPIDQRARVVIDEYRAQFPNGELKTLVPAPTPNLRNPTRTQTYQTLPPAPAEIAQLQNQKNQLILSTKEKLRIALGASEFAAFDGMVKDNATKVLSPIHMNSNTLPKITPSPSPSN